MDYMMQMIYSKIIKNYEIMICSILAACFLILNSGSTQIQKDGRRPWQSLKLLYGWSPIFQVVLSSIPMGPDV